MKGTTIEVIRLEESYRQHRGLETMDPIDGQCLYNEKTIKLK